MHNLRELQHPPRDQPKRFVARRYGDETDEIAISPMTTALDIRPLCAEEAHLIPTYFHSLSHQILRGMGVAHEKMPTCSAWTELLAEDLTHSDPDRQFFYLLWIVDGNVAGHSNINKIQFGQHAFAHLHLWDANTRQRGWGTALFSQSIEEYFRRFELQSIFCEPFAGNAAPNSTLPKAGFRLVKTYETLPGWINYHQSVNRWQRDRSTEAIESD